MPANIVDTICVAPFIHTKVLPHHGVLQDPSEVPNVLMGIVQGAPDE